MNNVRLLPIVIMAVAALLVFKTVGLVTNGGYVLGGITPAMAAGGGGGGHAPAGATPGETVTLPPAPTIEDATPTVSDSGPTMGELGGEGGHGAPAAAGDHGAPAAEDAGHGEAKAAPEGEAADADHAEAPTNVIAAENACAPVSLSAEGGEASPDGELTMLPPGCALPEDAVPQILSDGVVTPLGGNAPQTEQALLERLSTRRSELEAYEQDLAMRASLVQAAEQRLSERQETLAAVEAQIASLVEQREQMEEGQFAGIVAMYETMKPKDAATIFNALDMDVLLRVAKMMSPRRMSPILAEMDTARAQELTVKLASADADPLDSMTPDDLAALPQIVGQ